MKSICKTGVLCALCGVLLIQACTPNAQYRPEYNLTKIERASSIQQKSADDETNVSNSALDFNTLVVNDQYGDMSTSDFLANGQRHALLIAVDEYDDLPNLKTPKNDVKVLSGLLKRSYGFNTNVLINPTRTEIVKVLTNYRSTLGSNDSFLIYYAGHGWLDSDAEEGYWLPKDAQQSNPANWLSNSTITSYLKAIESRHLMVVADSCYSGTLTRGLNLQQKSPNYFQKMMSRKSRTVLTSGGLEPVSDVGGIGNHSIFASAFFKALNENPNILDGADIFAAVKRPVQYNSDQVPQYSIIHKAGHDGGDFLFIKQ